MLEQMRKQGASIFVYLIFSLLIVIFVINFRPGQSRNDENGCSGTSNVVLSVDGTDATQTAFKVAYSNPYNRGNGKQKVYVALETLIRRELLANTAEARGLRVTENTVMDQIKKGHFYLGGQRTMIPGILDEDGLWSLRAFKGWVGQLNISQNSYIDEQERSLLASMMAEILTESVQVSRDEALAHFLFEGNTATYDVVAFKPEIYRAAMKLTDADVARFLATHADEVSARYKTDERTYKGVKPQLQLRQIFIAKAEPPKPEEKPAEKPADESPGNKGSGVGSATGSGAGSAAATAAKAAKADDKKAANKTDAKKDDTKDAKADKKPVGMPIAEAKAKLEAARVAIAASKTAAQTFGDKARELSTDEASKSVGGDVGWHTADNAMLGDKAVNDAIKGLKPGEMTPVIETASGVFLVMAVEKREGDLGFDQVKQEIARDLAKDVWSKEAAKRAAINALASARAGVGLNLDQMYERDRAPAQPDIDFQKIINDPNLSNEQKQELLQQMIQRQNRHGSLVPRIVEGRDMPAGWLADTEGSADVTGGGGGAGAAVPPPAAPAAPTAHAGSAATAGSAAPVAAAGSAAPAAGAPAPPAAPPAPVAEPIPSLDTLPATSEVGKAHVARFGPSPRTKQMAGLGTSKEAATAVFDELGAGNLGKRIYEADGAFIIIQLVARAQPNIADFDKEADRRVSELRQSRAQAFLDEWLKDKCEALAKDNKIRPNQGLITDHDDQGKLLPITYKPCMSFH